MYQAFVSAVEGWAEELGNMHGRQQQFAISFIGVMNQYLTVLYDEQEGEQKIGEEQLFALVNQFMHGIFS